MSAAFNILRMAYPNDAASCPSEDCRIQAWPCRLLPNGWRLHILPMLFNNRLSLSTPQDAANGFATDGWCYDRDRLEATVEAFMAWDGQGDPPGPWKKHVTTGRRGPGAAPDPFASR